MINTTTVLSSKLKRKSADLLMLILYGQVYLIFFHDVCNMLNILSINQIFTYLYYAYLLVNALYCLISDRRKIASKLCIYFVTMFFFAINYFLGYADTENYFQTDMLLIYIAILPVCIFSLSEIDDWEAVFSYGHKITNMTVILSILAFFLSLFFNNNIYSSGDNINYMQLSYAVIPCLCIAYANLQRQFRTTELIGIIIATLLMLLYGSRACIGYYFLFIGLSIMFCSKKGRSIRQIIIAACLIVIVFFQDDLLLLAGKLGQQFNSRTLSALGKSQLFESQVRNQLYDNAKIAIKNMGFNIYGLFGDRYTVGKMFDNSYVHSIIYEVILSFGILLGPIALAYLVTLIIQNIRYAKDITERQATFMLVCALLLRFLFSGSFVSFPTFYMFITLMVCMRSKQKKRIRKAHLQKVIR